MTTTMTSPATFAYIDPAKLIDGPNVRSKIADLDGLVASIRARGVVVPIIVVKAKGGKFRVVAGARRTAAARIVGCHVPALIRDDLDAEQAYVEAQIIENLARVDLSPADEARAFEQLSLLGTDEDAIAMLTDRSLDEVRAGLTLARSKDALEVADQIPTLTLEQAAAIAEFESEYPEIALRLITAAEEDDRWTFEQDLVEARTDRDRIVEADAFRKDLAEKGIPLVEKAPGYALSGSRPCILDELKMKDGGRNATAATHAKCPGHAAYVVDAKYRPAAIVFCCTNPVEYGHVSRYATAAPETGSAEREAAAVDRGEVVAGNRAWRAATEVRTKFLRELLARKTPPKGALAFVAREILADPDGVGRTGNEKVLAVLLDVAEPDDAWTRKIGSNAAKQASDQRLVVLLLAQIAADREGGMGLSVWRDPTPTATRWLKFLVACGYKLSDVEKRVR